MAGATRVPAPLRRPTGAVAAVALVLVATLCRSTAGAAAQLNDAVDSVITARQPSPNPIPGADPTGVRDSAPALNAAAFNACASTSQLPGVPTDAVLDLAGGVYRLTRPLAINSSFACSGVLRIRSGTLLADPSLWSVGSNHSFLVTVLSYWNGLGVSLEHMVFANNGTGGGVRVDAAHHVHVVDSNFVNFKSVGIWGSSLLGMGHELAVDRCRMTECTDGMAACADIRVKNATAIVMEFPDSHFRNTIITCSAVGIVNRGGANTFHQLHIWTSCNPDATGDNLTVAFSEEGGADRITDCYFDNARLRITGYRGTLVANSYFNGRARLELAPNPQSGSINVTDPQCQYWRGAMCGLIVTGNRFSCASDSCAVLDTTLFTPPQANEVYVATNAFENTTATVCSMKDSCLGANDCGKLFGACAESGGGGLSARPAAAGWGVRVV